MMHDSALSMDRFVKGLPVPVTVKQTMNLLQTSQLQKQLKLSTPDTSRAMQQNQIEPILISDAVYTACGTTQQIPDSKVMTLSTSDVRHRLCNS